MSEEKKTRPKAPAVLRVEPSGPAAEWLKEQIGKAWRENVTAWLREYLEALAEAGQDADVFRVADSIAPGLARAGRAAAPESSVEVLHRTALDEIAARFDALRLAGKRLRLDVLDAERAALAAELEPSFDRRAAAEEYAAQAVQELAADPEDHDEADEPPPKKNGWDAAKERGTGGGP